MVPVLHAPGRCPPLVSQSVQGPSDPAGESGGRPLTPGGVSARWLKPQTSELPEKSIGLSAATAALTFALKGLWIASVITRQRSPPCRPVEVITKIGIPVSVWTGGSLVSS